MLLLTSNPGHLVSHQAPISATSQTIKKAVQPDIRGVTVKNLPGCGHKRLCQPAIFWPHPGKVGCVPCIPVEPKKPSQRHKVRGLRGKRGLVGSVIFEFQDSFWGNASYQAKICALSATLFFSTRPSRVEDGLAWGLPSVELSEPVRHLMGPRKSWHWFITRTTPQAASACLRCSSCRLAGHRSTRQWQWG
jgi:hypothetical protein